MQFKGNRTTVSVTFPFVAVITVMLILCRQDIVLVSVFSSLFHEIGHLFFILWFSQPPSLVCFGAFGIRIERCSGIILPYKKEAIIAMGGIFANCLLCLCGLFFYKVYNSIYGVQLFAVNLLVGAFNMLPVKVLDFGTFLENVLTARLGVRESEVLLERISRLTVAVLTAGCILYNIFVSLNISLIAVCIYLILTITLKEKENDK